LKTQTNWGKAENHKKLEKAINDWVNKEGDIFDKSSKLNKDPILLLIRFGSPLKHSVSISIKRIPELVLVMDLVARRG
jgi:hypothetical protein